MNGSEEPRKHGLQSVLAGAALKKRKMAVLWDFFRFIQDEYGFARFVYAGNKSPHIRLYALRGTNAPVLPGAWVPPCKIAPTRRRAPPGEWVPPCKIAPPGEWVPPCKIAPTRRRAPSGEWVPPRKIAPPGEWVPPCKIASLRRRAPSGEWVPPGKIAPTRRRAP
jgi:hypothetical protein